jgi:ABC-type polysaccharide/polyol phosphate export permease
MTAGVREYTYQVGDESSIWRFLRGSAGDAWNYRWAIETFITNNLRRRYRRSVLGFLWGMLGPLLNMAIMSVVFALIFHCDVKTYAIYIFTGLLPWAYMSESAVEGSVCFVNAEPYLKKLAIPKIFFPLVSVGTDTTNFLLSLSSLLLLGFAVGLKWQSTMLLLPFVILLTAGFNLGMILMFSILTVYLRDFTHILRVTLPAFFYMVPVLYPITAIPEQYRALLLLNPFYYPIKLFRMVIYDGQLPSERLWGAMLVLAIVPLLCGLLMLRKHEKHLIYRL